MNKEEIQVGDLVTFYCGYGQAMGLVVNIHPFEPSAHVNVHLFAPIRMSGIHSWYSIRQLTKLEIPNE
jgi:hypothetical protein